MPEPGRQTTAVVAAMRDEIEPLRRRLRAAPEGTEGRLSWWRGELGEIDVVLAVTGEGRHNAADGIRRIVERFRPDRILGVGLGGALSEPLAVGDLVLSGEVLDGAEALGAPDPAWLARTRARAGCAAGRLVTVDEILDTPVAKARWRGAAEGQPAVADLESASYARVAADHRLPYLIARAVSDRADESLPSFLSRCRRRDGSVDRFRVILCALWRPGSWPTLWRLRARTRQCALRLADLAEAAITAAA